MQIGRIPLAHVLSAERREMRAELSVRRALVETRAQFIVTVRGLLRSWGLHAPKCDAQNFVLNVDRMVRAEQLPKNRHAQLSPLMSALKTIDPQIKALDAAP